MVWNWSALETGTKVSNRKQQSWKHSIAEQFNRKITESDEKLFNKYNKIPQDQIKDSTVEIASKES